MKKKYEIKTKDKYELKHHKDFHGVQFQDFKVRERNLIYALCYQLMEQESNVLEFDVKEIAKIANYSPTKAGDNIYRSLEEAYKKIKNASISLKKENGVKHFVLFTVFETFEDIGKVKIRVNDEYRYLLNKITAPFTIQNLIEYTRIGSGYAQLTYSLLKEWEKLKKLRIEIEDFKRLLGVPETYDTANFNRLIIKPILKELPKYFEGLELEKIKTGKKVTHLEFTWKGRKESFKNEIEDVEVIKISQALNKTVEKTRKNRFLYGVLTDENIIKLLEMFDEKALIKGLNYAYKEISHEIKSINYLKKTIESANLVKSKKLVVEKDNVDEVKELENENKEKNEIQKTLKLDNITEMSSKSNKPEEFNNLDKKNQKSVENEALEICAKEQQIDKKFLEMMKEKSEVIYWNTLKPYIERVMKKDSF